MKETAVVIYQKQWFYKLGFGLTGCTWFLWESFRLDGRKPWLDALGWPLKIAQYIVGEYDLTC